MGICPHILAKLVRIKFNENSSIGSRVIIRRQTDIRTNRQTGRHDTPNRRILDTFYWEYARNIYMFSIGCISRSSQMYNNDN
jgi:acetyltransferase-like isoleucine patch superfamily enzyme